MDQDTLRMILREAVRETTTEVLQILLNADREAFLQEHGGRKNGHYSRKLETAFGQVGLAIPRDREGRYYPSLLQPYARRMVDVGEVAIALYASGVTQRKAAEVLQLLFGMRYTHQTISTLTDQVLQAAEQFRQRPLPEELALVYLDGLFLKVLGEEGVERAAVYVVLGVSPAGERQVWTNPFGTGKARAPSWATGACPARTPGVEGLVASGPEAGAVVHHRWSGGPSASHPEGLPAG